jgi:predicted RNA-binding protein with RPS1 domain
VTNVTNFGAFVDVGVHQDGLVHISELAHQFVDDPRKVVSPGDHVQVRVLAVDPVKNQISLSMKLEAASNVEFADRRREDSGFRASRGSEESKRSVIGGGGAGRPSKSNARAPGGPGAFRSGAGAGPRAGGFSSPGEARSSSGPGSSSGPAPSSASAMRDARGHSHRDPSRDFRREGPKEPFRGPLNPSPGRSSQGRSSAGNPSGSRPPAKPFNNPFAALQGLGGAAGASKNGEDVSSRSGSEVRSGSSNKKN